MIRMKGRELSSEEFQEFKDGLNRYARIEGVDSKLVNIPTVVTGLNDNGTIKEEKTDPYAYEIIQEYRSFKD